MATGTTRRKFLQHTAAIGGGYWIGGQTRVRAQSSALQTLSAGCVGVGGKGSSDVSHIGEMGVKIAALCDVDETTITKKAREFSDAKLFDDYREMLNSMGDQLDIVVVSTPDHTHAVAALKAMRMGKHVYCQKPLTWSIQEARMMREVAKEEGVVTQMGNQGTSQDGLREAVEVLRSGAIGDVKEVHVWSNRPIWPQGQGRPEGEDPIPDGLNWDGWIGPAPMRPFKAGAYHAFNWRGWVDFGTGALGDMACHTTNMPVMALQLFDPIAVTAVKNPGIFENETYPESSKIKFEFAPRGDMPACDFYWYDGGALPDDSLVSQLPESFQKRVAKQREGEQKTSACVVVGSKGILFSPDDYGSKYYLLPADDFKDFQKPSQSLPRIPFQGGVDQRQKWEFVKTITGEYDGGTMSNFGHAGRLTETILVGNLALRAGEGKRVEWDAETMKCTNAPELNDFVQRQCRDGYPLQAEPAAAAAS